MHIRPFLISALILATALVTTLLAFPAFARDIHDTGSFAKCMAEGNQCLAEGRPKADCERVVESCLDSSDNKEREIRATTPTLQYMPHNLRERCVALVDDCFNRTLNMDACVVDMYRCQDDKPAENCCPKRCIDKYNELTASGTSEFEAYSRVFRHNAYSCFNNP